MKNQKNHCQLNQTFFLYENLDDYNFQDIIDYIQIATTGNAADFGDMAYMTDVVGIAAVGSNGHGGLSG